MARSKVIMVRRAFNRNWKLSQCRIRVGEMVRMVKLYLTCLIQNPEFYGASGLSRAGKIIGNRDDSYRLSSLKSFSLCSSFSYPELLYKGVFPHMTNSFTLRAQSHKFNGTKKGRLVPDHKNFYSLSKNLHN